MSAMASSSTVHCRPHSVRRVHDVGPGGWDRKGSHHGGIEAPESPASRIGVQRSERAEPARIEQRGERVCVIERSRRDPVHGVEGNRAGVQDGGEEPSRQIGPNDPIGRARQARAEYLPGRTMAIVAAAAQPCDAGARAARRYREAAGRAAVRRSRVSRAGAWRAPHATADKSRPRTAGRVPGAGVPSRKTSSAPVLIPSCGCQRSPRAGKARRSRRATAAASGTRIHGVGSASSRCGTTRRGRLGPEGRGHVALGRRLRTSGHQGHGVHRGREGSTRPVEGHGTLDPPGRREPVPQRLGVPARRELCGDQQGHRATRCGQLVRPVHECHCEVGEMREPAARGRAPRWVAHGQSLPHARRYSLAPHPGGISHHEIEPTPRDDVAELCFEREERCLTITGTATIGRPEVAPCGPQTPQS